MAGGGGGEGKKEGVCLRGCEECGLSVSVVGGCPSGSRQKGELSGSEVFLLLFAGVSTALSDV